MTARPEECPNCKKYINEGQPVVRVYKSKNNMRDARIAEFWCLVCVRGKCTGKCNESPTGVLPTPYGLGELEDSDVTFTIKEI